MAENKSVKEAYCSYETSRLLKEKGFDEPLQWVIHSDGTLIQLTERGLPITCPNSKINPYGDSVSAVTQQMACRWLREVHHIHVCPEYKAFFQECPRKIYHHWCNKIVGINRCFKRDIQAVDVLDSDYFFFHDAKTYHDSFEESCEECIKFALKNLITE